ncbi:VOC family protein [Thermocoleostomius sinensis]|uniref:VOC family protein n=1 Tax=Thermocoleostomius sinensis A174 TaxID=2016057 RepID=A0A9E8ZK41_9CYAN|nr:VOC family protein [Thermocoleostomius sinensis]WAL62678.1 VOC family protein [Thermocoleostomius sinensis A174]
MNLDRLDHLVLTVRDLEATCDFYTTVLGMTIVTFGDNRKALQVGQQKINLHQAGQEFEPKAAAPTPGSADVCFMTSTPLEHVIIHLQTQGVAIEEGIVPRTGTLGAMRSIYIRDPDGNLIELSNSIDCCA